MQINLFVKWHFEIQRYLLWLFFFVFSTLFPPLFWLKLFLSLDQILWIVVIATEVCYSVMLLFACFFPFDILMNSVYFFKATQGI